MNITLQQLEYIIALDTYRHYVTAAEKSFVTQPTLSMQIKKLEEQLGVVLFDRSKQPIVPTLVGTKVIEQARTIVSESKKIHEIVNQFQSKIEGELVVGVIPTLAPYLVPLFIGPFLKAFPEVRLTIKELLTDEIVNDLKKEKLDAGIIVTPLEEKGIIERKLFYEEIFLFSNEKEKSSPITTNQLKQKKIWLLAQGHCFRSQVVNLCAESTEHQENFNYESGSLESLKRLVKEEGGATLLPELAVEDLNVKQKENAYSIATRPHREISLVHSRAQSKISLLEVLGKEIIKSVPISMLEVKQNIVDWR